MNHTNSMIFAWVAVGLLVIFTMPFSQGYTDAGDVYAINNLYVALGSPPLPGWIPNGGDPCTEAWQGVQCVNSNITSIILNGANLGGQLGDKLENFSAIITIDLSNNQIGGSIPEDLPITMSKFFLSANQFTGSIPTSLSKLTLLSDMSVNSNLLSGELPDAFQSLTSLINLDLSSNNMSGKLPPSMGSLSSLTTLHMQNNQLSGTLDVLQDLPLKDLNIENNLFSGPVPEKLLNIPNFKKDGNPFNTTIAPSSMPLPPPLPRSGAPIPVTMPADSSEGPSIQDSGPPGRHKSLSTLQIIAYALVAVALVIVALLVFLFCVSKCRDRKSKHDRIPKGQEGRGHGRPEVPKIHNNLIKPSNEVKKVPKEAAEKRKEEHEIDMTGTDILVLPPPVEKVIVNPIAPPEKITKTSENLNPPPSVKSFSVASLQQYTNSFREENLIRDSRFGKVYLAELPEGKLLAVMKLDNLSLKLPDGEFLELVLSISELRHPNIVELVGYCAEHGQRLLVYNYFSKKTLYDILHFGDDLKGKLSWNARIQVALGAARALEYLHEGCQPPVVHQNFESANVLFDDELVVQVSECGLAKLTLSNPVTQLSGRLRSLFTYEAPEVNEFGTYTDRSDVFSFGVVMLELLTGRKPYDSSRPRAEQRLVRWASSQLHDINALSRMVDPSVNGKYPVKSLSRFADIISRCIQHGPEFRPPMSEVVQDLTRMVEEMSKRSNGNSDLV